jgi:GR25 family glycosyltransferase involved in LPS biosynthesis
MNFNTYIINLKQDTKKWNNIVDLFTKTNLNIIRFNAINGKNADVELVEKHSIPYCKHFCPKSVLGCGLSHVLVAKYFLENDQNDFCLILEDDVIPLYENLTNEIHKCIDRMKGQSWDIIKVYCHGICSYDKEKMSIPSNILTSSTAAYILSKSGAEKINKLKVAWHIDKQFGASDLLIYLNTYPLFDSYFEDSSTSEKGYLMSFVPDYSPGNNVPPISYIFGLKIFYEPYTGIDIIGCHFLLCFVVSIVVFLLYYVVSSTYQDQNSN